MSDVNTIVREAASLPSIPDAEIQQAFNSVQGSWDAERILLMSEADLRNSVAKILAGDKKEGFGRVDCTTDAPYLNGKSLQFNTMSDSHFRGHRIAKKQNGGFALFGHDSTYRHLKTSSGKQWWQFWK